MLWSLESVRSAVRNREGKRVFFLPKGDQLTSEARDWLKSERIDQRIGDGSFGDYQGVNGEIFAQKPEYMTHLKGNTLVSKLSPRIALRGKMDSLQAFLLYAMTQTKRREGLSSVLEYVRQLLRCEVMEEPVPECRMLGLTSAELREHSHHPERYYARGHFRPEAEEGTWVLALNLCRTQAREAELAAVRAFTDQEGRVTRMDFLEAMNRVSSAIYLLMIQGKE